MKSRIIGACLVVVVALGALVILNSNSSLDQTTKPHPVLSIQSGVVTLTAGGTIRDAVNQEEIIPPVTLTTSGDSRAVLTFTEGSELRLDPNSTLHIDDATYGKDGGLSVSVFLSIGRVWSNIVALATPESSWEVKTSNVVATVRGTAFGVSATTTGDTLVVGSEHTVSLTPRNPDTGETYEDAGTLLEETDFALITNSLIADIEAHEDGSGSTTPRITTASKTNEMYNDPWIRDNTRKDNPDRTIPEPTEQTPSPTPTSPIPDIRTTRPSTTVTAAQPKSITVTAAGTLDGIIEGTAMRLTATLIYDDGTTKDITAAARWSVVGEIGTMNGSVFTPLLTPKMAEFGRAPGSITATWKDPVTGVELFGATPAFEVKAKVIELIPQG